MVFLDWVECDLSPPLTTVYLDARFVEVCEPGTIRVMAVNVLGAGKPATARAVEGGGKVEVLSTADTRGLRALVTLVGLRRGFGGQRFARVSEDVALRSNRFWRDLAEGRVRGVCDSPGEGGGERYVC